MSRCLTLTAGWRRLARSLWPALVLLGSPRALPAQIPDWLAPGHRVLILRKTDGPMITGVITRRRGDSITVAEGAGETHLAGADIGQLEVSRARRSMAATGAALGLGLGVLTGVAAGAAGRNDQTASAFVEAIIFAAIGAPVGALLGSIFQTDVWARIYPAARPRLSFAPAVGGIRAAITLPTAAIFGGNRP